MHTTSHQLLKPSMRQHTGLNCRLTGCLVGGQIQLEESVSDQAVVVPTGQLQGAPGPPAAQRLPQKNSCSRASAALATARAPSAHETLSYVNTGAATRQAPDHARQCAMQVALQATTNGRNVPNQGRANQRHPIH